jgi:hypothetical protein
MIGTLLGCPEEAHDGLFLCRDALLRHLNVDPMTAPGPPSDRVKELAADPKRRIDAIRLYRSETGADLRQAKAIVESIAHPG